MDGGQKPDPQTENDLDDDIINLTEVVPESGDDDVIELTHVMEQPDQAPSAIDQADEAAIPLTNTMVVEEPAAKAPEAPSPEESEPIIDLTEAVAPEAELPAADLAIPLEAAETGTAPIPVEEAGAAPPISEAQVEAALERVIKKIYGEKIERLLVETIQRTIGQEIEKIKADIIGDDKLRQD
ncbi:conserved hypothetical protein [Desulfosarcina cetonica]|nr:conserved hypothetical protein [Desulfosarcina cetonica]